MVYIVERDHMPLWVSNQDGEVQVLRKVGSTNVSDFFPPVSTGEYWKRVTPCC